MAFAGPMSTINGGWKNGLLAAILQVADALDQLEYAC